MGKAFKLGFVIGRFQNIHIGHERMVRTALNNCEKVILMVGSSQESGTVRNPFTLYTRMNLIRKVFRNEILEGNLLLAHTDDMTHEDDHCVEWGKFLLKKIEMWKSHYGIKDELDCMVYGNDEERMSWFDPKDVENVGQIILNRNGLDISATRLRKALAEDDYEFYDMFVSQEISSLDILELREELLEIPHYKKMLEEKNV